MRRAAQPISRQLTAYGADADAIPGRGWIREFAEFPGKNDDMDASGRGWTAPNVTPNPFTPAPKTQQTPSLIGRTGDLNTTQRFRKPLAEPETAGSPAGRDCWAPRHRVRPFQPTGSNLSPPAQRPQRPRADTSTPSSRRVPRAPWPLPLRVQFSLGLDRPLRQSRFRLTHRSRATNASTPNASVCTPRRVGPVPRSSLCCPWPPPSASASPKSRARPSTDTVLQHLAERNLRAVDVLLIYVDGTAFRRTVHSRRVRSTGGCRCRSEEGPLRVPATPIMMSEWRSA